MHVDQGHILLTFGLLLAGALVAGVVADRLRLPRVTAYLLIGLGLGPSVLDWLNVEHLELLDPLTKLAMALVLFGLGCRFPFSRAKRVLPKAAKLSLSEISLTFLLVAVGLLLAGIHWTVALLVAALAVESAPATTILVLRDCEAEGPVTENTNTLVLLNNVTSIVLFEVLFLIVHLAYAQQPGSWIANLRFLLQDLLGAVLFGLTAGVVVAYCCVLVAASRWLVLLVAITTFCLGINEVLGTPYMLSCIVMGLTVANTSELSAKIVAELDRLTGFLCVLFFVIHGAELNASAVLTAGTLGLLYIFLRTAGKYVGAFWAAGRVPELQSVRRWVGGTLFAHAGLAIALSAAAKARDPLLGEQIQAVILGPVVLFELLGPVLIRLSVLQAGEVPLAQAVRHSTSSPLEELARIARHILSNLGLDFAPGKPLDELQVKDFLRKNIDVLQETATFDEVVQLIAQSRDNAYPVVDESSRLVGVIYYTDLSRVLFDREVTELVNASDLARPVTDVLFPQEPIEKALKLFRRGRNDVLFVVEPDGSNQLIGVVRRRDLTSFLVGRKNSDAGGH